MNTNVLMRTIVDVALFFELSDEAAINPDVAIAQLEAIAASLQELSETDRNTLLSYVDHRAEQVRHSGSAEVAEFLCSFGESFGLR